MAVDFDGVIHSYTSGWTGEIPTDPPNPGVHEFLRELDQAGARIIVYSTRAKTEFGKGCMWRWLRTHHLSPYVEDITDGKPIAVAYVDDRAVEFRGDWGAALEDVIELAAVPSGKLRPGREPLPAAEVEN